jgi:seryl-tRNA synthetase
VKKSQELRFNDIGLIDEVIGLDQEWRKKNFAVQKKQKELNQVQKVIREMKKASKGADPCAEEFKKSKEINGEVEQLKEIEAEAYKILKQKVLKIRNIVHESVPVSKNEDDNRIERTWGEPNRMIIDNTPGHYFHHEVLTRIDGYDNERGQKIVGYRGYFLKGYGLLLNQALINYGLQFLMQ